MTTAIPAIDRGDLAERLIPTAAALACVVHGDGDRHTVAHVLDQLDPIERDGLIVVLAALVNPDSRLDDVLQFVTWDEYGAPAEQPLTGLSIRQVAAVVHPPTEHPTRRTAEIVEDTALLAARGLGRREIAARFGISWGYVQSCHTREGVRVPEVAGW
ncbi:hypothetical protein ACWEPB_02515 [Kitasatospora cineracea]